MDTSNAAAAAAAAEAEAEGEGEGGGECASARGDEGWRGGRGEANKWRGGRGEANTGWLPLRARPQRIQAKNDTRGG
eukprot:1422533-Rhodomonas_salina.2